MEQAHGIGAALIALERLRERGGRVAFVPTMGALHDGHLSLIELARQHADAVVASIFVNPLQFAPGEDLERYPRDLPGDTAKLESAGADLLFTVTPREMYPESFATFVNVEGSLTEGLCARSRPGHFRGVTTVVAKLFGMVRPQVAVFGRKDLQQALVLRRMVTDLCWPIEMVIAPIVREADGLAMSSRNRYLSPAERSDALSLSRGLAAAERAIAGGELDTTRIASLVREQASPGVGWDYVEVTHLSDLRAQGLQLELPAAIIVAALVGKTRLIDNLVLPHDAI